MRLEFFQRGRSEVPATFDDVQNIEIEEELKVE